MSQVLFLRQILAELHRFEPAALRTWSEYSTNVLLSSLKEGVFPKSITSCSRIVFKLNMSLLFDDNTAEFVRNESPEPFLDFS